MTDWDIREPKSSAGCRFKGNAAKTYVMKYSFDERDKRICGSIMNKDRYCEERFCPIKDER